MSSDSPKTLDDPRLQEMFSETIMGAMMFGAQNSNRPPEGHWLNQFWDIGRKTTADSLSAWIGDNGDLLAALTTLAEGGLAKMRADYGAAGQFRRYIEDAESTITKAKAMFHDEGESDEQD